MVSIIIEWLFTVSCLFDWKPTSTFYISDHLFLNSIEGSKVYNVMST